ncbi:hypothetical protein [Pacificoceanicola onchidii]|uniref:hypothetical protein n=1 Tax=Pacificoceanicola onchidii TaxID=2562685 RepID=UPI0010A659CE|nr:hypothetical protein [Pacificoceanicola onchidii]
MIISHKHQFVFFHNPKAGGTSIRSAIAPFNDIGFGLWHADPAQTKGIEVDRAHLGIDEFAGFYPDLWAEVQGYALFCLIRDPRKRFLSSVSEYCRTFTDTDLRLASPEEGRDMVFRVMDRLAAKGSAETVLDDFSLTHFKPQHLYWRSGQSGIRAKAYETADIAGLFATLSERTGSEIHARQERAAETYDLPPAARLLHRAKGLQSALKRVPGMAAVLDRGKRAARARYATGQGRRLALSEADETAITAFVRDFYAQDYALWPIPEAAS